MPDHAIAQRVMPCSCPARALGQNGVPGSLPPTENPMRAAFTLVGLLLALFLIMKLGSRQIETLAPAGAGSAPRQAEAIAAQIRQATEAGAAARASEAAAP